MLLVLADAELELVPEVMLEDQIIRDLVKREGKSSIIVDNFLMRESISKHFPTEVGRMGFPDIAYMFVRMNEGSILNSVTRIDYAIHTKHNDVIERRDLSGMEAGYQEFKTRVENILEGNGKKMSLIRYLESRGAMGNTVILHPCGRKGLVVNDRLNYVIGGFPEGDFRSELGNLGKFSIYGKEITVPSVLELLHFKILGQAAYP